MCVQNDTFAITRVTRVNESQPINDLVGNFASKMISVYKYSVEARVRNKEARPLRSLLGGAKGKTKRRPKETTRTKWK